MIEALSDAEKYWIFIGVLFYFGSCFTSFGLGTDSGRKMSRILPSYETISFKSLLALKYLSEIEDSWDSIANMTNEFGESVISFLLADGYIGLIMKANTPCVILTSDGKSALSRIKFAKLPE